MHRLSKISVRMEVSSYDSMSPDKITLYLHGASGSSILGPSLTRFLFTLISKLMICF